MTDSKSLWTTLLELFRLKVKYAMSSAIATAVDYGVYFSLVGRIFQPAIAQMIAYPCGVVVNFLLQKRFVFQLERSPWHAFGLAALVSVGGMLLSSGIIHGLTQMVFFNRNQLIAKILTSGIVFFYNFYLKRYVFERRFI